MPFHLIQGGGVAVQVTVLVRDAAQRVAVHRHIGAAGRDYRHGRVSGQILVLVGAEQLDAASGQQGRGGGRLGGAHDGVGGGQALWAPGLGVVQAPKTSRRRRLELVYGLRKKPKAGLAPTERRGQR
jgi:hypothetical protein